MNFDMAAYNTIFNAMRDILAQNMQQVGQDFAERFLNDYNPQMNRDSQNNAMNLYRWVIEQAQSRLGKTTLNNSQLFELLGEFINEIFRQYRMAQPRGGFGNGFVSGAGYSGFGSGNRFGSMNQGGGMFSQNQRTGPASHLADDSIAPSGGSMQNNTPRPTTMSDEVVTPMTTSVPQAVSYSVNPLDDYPDTAQGDNLAKVTEHPNWGEGRPKDNRIVLAARETLKSRDGRFAISRISAVHQEIINDPMTVVRDFFDIVPDQVLGTDFLAKIQYQHLEIIDVPTKEFSDIRQKCVEAVAENPETLLHKTLMKTLDTMKAGSYKAITAYLTKQINRALELSARLSTNPKAFIQITTFDDVDELLSSSFQHEITRHPEGRIALERMVGAAIWNALVMNSDAMFTDGNIPTNAMQTSPAFPFSMEDVYPAKSAIPIKSDAMADDFMKRLQEKELDHKTYILSRRSVVITNILGRKVLPLIHAQPSRIDNPIAAILNTLAANYTNVRIDARDAGNPVKPIISEDYATDQLEEYYEDKTAYAQSTADKTGRKIPVMLPVDQTIFAVQYGKSPSDYLMAMDVFTTIDNPVSQNQVILRKKTIPSISVNV